MYFKFFWNSSFCRYDFVVVWLGKHHQPKTPWKLVERCDNFIKFIPSIVNQLVSHLAFHPLLSLCVLQRGLAFIGVKMVESSISPWLETVHNELEKSSWWYLSTIGADFLEDWNSCFRLILRRQICFSCNEWVFFRVYRFSIIFPYFTTTLHNILLESFLLRVHLF